MTDIVERLHARGASYGVGHVTLMEEAADEIERLRGELHSVHAHLNYLRSEIDRLRGELRQVR